MDKYIIINRTALEKMKKELNKGSAHHDGIYISDYQHGQIDLIDVIISSQSTPLIPEIEKAFDVGSLKTEQCFNIYNGFVSGIVYKDKENYILNLKLDI